MSDDAFSGLIDDRGAPVRWKAATIIAMAVLIVTVVLQIAKAGAKSEKLEALSADVKDLKEQSGSVIYLKAQVQEQGHHLDQIEGKIDKLLDRRR